MNTPPIIHKYLDWVSSCYDKWPCNRNMLFFRGQSNSKWDLLPSVFRKSDKNLEQRVILDYKQVAVTDMNYQPKIENMLVTMQHNGIPTRLLDWSMSPLIALFFACQPKENKPDASVYCQPEENNPDASVYCLNPWGAYYNIQSRLKPHIQLMDILKESRMKIAQRWSFKEVKTYIQHHYNYKLEHEALRVPVPFVGRYMTDRLSAQLGAFLIWGDGDAHHYAPGLHVDLKKFSEYDDFCIDFTIPSTEKDQALQFLRKLDITNFTIFPDTRGFTEDVKNNNGIFRI